MYLGVRAEITDEMLVKNLRTVFNFNHEVVKIFDVCEGGKIAVKRDKIILTARGIKNGKHSTGLTNFSIMLKCKKFQRCAQIINILGNDRLIREKVSTFVDGKSLLNSMPELETLREAFF